MSTWKVFPVYALSALSLCAAPQAVEKLAVPVTAPKSIQQAAKKTEDYKSFTGRVTNNKVRLRVAADLDSYIFRQLNKNDLLLVVGETGDFYQVLPPKDAKAYVFRPYILDNVVETARVNIRLEPHIDGPIIGQLQAGDKVESTVCAMNHKWLEIALPSTTRFFVSKEFLTNAGGPDYLTTIEKKKKQVEELFNSALLSAEAENKKTYEEMSPQSVIEQFGVVVRNYPEFPETTERARASLTAFKDAYLQKKITYLEARAQLSGTVKEEILARHKSEEQELFTPQNGQTDSQFWGKIEESLYLSWTAFHSGRKIDDFYSEQKANSVVVTGLVEPINHAVKQRPGDYLLRSNETPVAYLYSTSVDLKQFEGKEVTLQVSPRPNNHFAFPAYFVLSVE
jgi:uncharacterized protein YgiM (DUF1202 family)